MKRTVKVMRVIDRLNVGGPAIHAVLTTRGLAREQFRTVLVTGSIEPGEADMSYLLVHYGVERELIPSLGRELRPLRDLSTAWQLYRLMRRERPDIVHTHKAKAGAIGRVCALAAGVPVRVHTYHGHIFHGYFGHWKTRAFIAIERLLAGTTTRLIALSQGLVHELAERYRIAPADHFSIVPLGFDFSALTDLEPHRGALRARLGVAPDGPLVGIVGRMVPVKDHATFVAAAALLAARRPEVSFVLVGGGELEAAVRSELERHGLAGRAHMLGWTEDLAPIYANLDAVALSSINEGTPVTLIEAMAAGIPVVATAVGGVPDLLRGGELGELVPPRDPAALADGIERALSPSARTRARSARSEILNAFSEERLCADLARLYLNLLDERRPSG